jgi:ribose transport system ATP-binding protein
MTSPPARRTAPKMPRAAVRLGMGFVSSNRGEESIASMLSVRENVFPSGLLLGRDKSWICLPSRERADGTSVLKRFSVRPPDPDKLIDNLSGGNQQKVILARWLTFPGRILILDEPTFGVDVGSRQEIYAALKDATQDGMGVLLVSSDMEEVANVCSRALVMQSGRITAEVSREELSAERLTALTVAD